jgi:hypothetical protein
MMQTANNVLLTHHPNLQENKTTLLHLHLINFEIHQSRHGSSFENTISTILHGMILLGTKNHFVSNLKQ